MADEIKKDRLLSQIDIEFTKPLRLLRSCDPSPPFSDAKLTIVDGEFHVKVTSLPSKDAAKE